MAYQVPSLQEPVDATIVRPRQMRDLGKVWVKLKYTLMPQAAGEQGKQLRDWDLWGPLFFCLLLAFTLSVSSTGHSEDSSTVAFGLVFTVVWIGAAVITFNAQLLGSSMYLPLSSFFQSVCALGYCLVPVTLGAVLGLVLGSSVMLVRLLCVAGGVVWSVKSAFGFMEQLTPEKRWKLTAYPVLLFYIFLGWLVLIV